MYAARNALYGNCAILENSGGISTSISADFLSKIVISTTVNQSLGSQELTAELYTHPRAKEMRTDAHGHKDLQKYSSSETESTRKCRSAFIRFPSCFCCSFSFSEKLCSQLKLSSGNSISPLMLPQKHTHTEKKRERDKRNTNTSHSCSDMSSVCLLSLANRQLELTYKESKTEKQTYQTGERGVREGNTTQKSGL